VKELIKGKIVTAPELTKLMATENTNITYNDIKKTFIGKDLEQYDALCTQFLSLVANKSNKEQWDMLLNGTPAGLDLVSTLNRIQKLREKYNLIGTFHKLWKAKPLKNGNFEYDEISW
jgi:hypothetical protein